MLSLISVIAFRKKPVSALTAGLITIGFEMALIGLIL